MIICDGCESKGTINKHNCFVVKIDATHETYHLCNDCVEIMKAAIFKPLPEPVKEKIKKIPALKKSVIPKKSKRKAL